MNNSPAEKTEFPLLLNSDHIALNCSYKWNDHKHRSSIQQDLSLPTLLSLKMSSWPEPRSNGSRTINRSDSARSLVCSSTHAGPDKQCASVDPEIIAYWTTQMVCRGTESLEMLACYYRLGVCRPEAVCLTAHSLELFEILISAKVRWIELWVVQKLFQQN